MLAGIGLFFTCLMLFADGANPFARLDPAPAEGVGLNPLLRHPAMAIHPPMLYSGYVLWSIPFAFAIGALISRRLDASWIRSTRRFALVAWIFLSIGILLGSRWSYSELGWGGYWGWDAVENASLMPWLVGTAFLHSVMVQEKRGMLKVWNVSLIVATFTLALLGTFLVRSGILESIHAFGASTVGGPLLALIAVVIVGSAALIVSRLDDLRSERRIESLASRESVFLVNNLLLVGLCVVIFWGTFFPLISEAITGERSSLGSPWFDRYTTPLAIVLVLFTGIGPLLAWRRVSAGSLWRLVRAPLAVAVAATVAVAAFTDALEHPLALVAVRVRVLRPRGAGGRVLARRRRRSAALSGGGAAARRCARVTARNRRRYGGYIVHAGIAILFIAVAASSSFQTSEDLRLTPGESRPGRRLHGHLRAADQLDRPRGAEPHLRLDDPASSATASRSRVLRPSRNYYSHDRGRAARSRGFFEGEATSEVGRRTQVERRPVDGDASRPRAASTSFIGGADRRIAAATEGGRGRQRPVPRADAGRTCRGWRSATRSRTGSREGDLPVDFRVNVNPFVIWIWIGGAIGDRRRPDRGLARARGAPAPGLRRLRGAPRARPRARSGHSA